MSQTPSTPPESKGDAKEFNVKLLRSIKDEKLEQAVLDYIFSKIAAQPKRLREVIQALPPGFRVFYFTWLVESEVMNGGFNQYFWNASAQFAEQTPAALEAIGDSEAAAIVRNAVRTAMAEAATRQAFKQAGTLEAFSESYKHTKLHEFDGPFVERAEKFPALRIQYIRQHEQAFVTP